MGPAHAGGGGPVLVKRARRGQLPVLAAGSGAFFLVCVLFHRFVQA